MKIIAHRGFWNNKAEQNSFVAFERALKNGFGIETDLRDANRRLVISHDLPSAKARSLRDFLKLYRKIDKKNSLTLALNIKADGLQNELQLLLKEFSIRNYFVFDASVPDLLRYQHSRMRFFTRQSDFEPSPALYKNASGIWLDELQTSWISKNIILKHVEKNKQVCIVSPELHKRSYAKKWAYLKDNLPYQSDQLLLCTDDPVGAARFFATTAK